MKKIFFLFLAAVFFFGYRAQASSYVLGEGWNLVSADVIFSLTDDSALLDRVMKNGAIYALNPRDKQYYGGSGSRESLRELDKIASALPHGDESSAALGYWVYVSQYLSVNVDFTAAQKVESKYETTNYQLVKGWNLIGVTGLMTGKPLSGVKGSCELESVYNFERGEWRKQTDADLKELFTKDSLGHGLAVKVSNDCAFNFGKSSLKAPSLPK